MILVAFAAISRTVGHLSKSAEVMKLVNNLMKAPEMAVAMQEFSKEMTKVYFCITLFPSCSYIS
jgi:charged multivesicular body protein 3